MYISFNAAIRPRFASHFEQYSQLSTTNSFFTIQGCIQFLGIATLTYMTSFHLPVFAFPYGLLACCNNTCPLASSILESKFRQEYFIYLYFYLSRRVRGFYPPNCRTSYFPHPLSRHYRRYAFPLTTWQFIIYI